MIAILLVLAYLVVIGLLALGGGEFLSGEYDQ